MKGHGRYRLAAILAACLLVAASVSSAGYEQVAYASFCPLGLTQPILKTTSLAVAGGQANDQSVVTTATWGCAGVEGPFVAIIEARNSHGVTELLGWQAGQLGPPDDSVQITLDWDPIGSGEYELRTFAITSFENPEVLSGVRIRDVWLGESPAKTVITIPYDPEPATEELNFEPSLTKVVLGINNTIVWTNKDNVSHTLIEFPDFESPFDFHNVSLHPGQSFQRDLTQAGSLYYKDADRYWMGGSVWVIPHDAVNAYLNFTINGLSDSYNLDEPVQFSVDISGFETGCGDVSIQVERIDTGRAQDSPGWSTGAHYDCFRVEAPYRNFTLHFPLSHDGPEYKVAINQTGTYRLTVSFDMHFSSAHYGITREFVVESG